jgi:hypothetical protein
VIDGQSNEWEQPLNFYDDKTKLLFAIANDSSNIYFCFESKDPLNQMKLMRAGMKVTLSLKGKTKHNASVEFPLPQSQQVAENNNAENNAMQNTKDNDNTSYQHQDHDSEYFRKNFILNHLMMDAEGFASGNGIVPVKNPSGINAAINWDSSSDLVYELAIPVKEFFGDGYTAKNATDEITLNVEVNALKQTSSPGENSGGSDYHGSGRYGSGTRSGGYRGGTGGGEGHGGMHSGGRQWSDEDRTSLGVKTSFKQKFILSKGAE